MKNFLYILLISFAATAQQVTTITGFAGSGYVDGALATAQFSAPADICSDSAGNLYIGDISNYVVRRIDVLTGLVSTVTGSTEGFADGNLATAKFSRPGPICMDSNGNLFVADVMNHKIRKIDLSTGIVSTFAGSTQGFANGFGISAKFNEPSGICIDSNDNLYVSEYQGSKIRKITPARMVTTLAGSGILGFADGVGTAAKFNAPQDLCVDNLNNIYVIDTFNAKIRKITPDGTVTTIAGSTAGYQDGSALQAQFLITDSICIDNNNLYITDSNNRIRKLDLTTNIVSTFVGSLTGVSGETDGDVNQALLNGPFKISIVNNIIYFTQYNGKIRKITNFLATDNFTVNDVNINYNQSDNNLIVKSNYNLDKIIIYNLLGKTIYNEQNINSDNKILNCNYFAKGIYFVNITTIENTTIRKKIIVN
jgi:sugar lactone lactonase YvrE